MVSEQRYRLRAYICGPGCVRWRPDEGFTNFTRIYINRPDGCRYAVVETTDHAFLVWDLFDTLQDPLGELFPAAVPGITYTDLDQAVAATALRYEA